MKTLESLPRVTTGDTPESPSSSMPHTLPALLQSDSRVTRSPLLSCPMVALPRKVSAHPTAVSEPVVIARQVVAAPVPSVVSPTIVIACATVAESPAVGGVAPQVAWESQRPGAIEVMLREIEETVIDSGGAGIQYRPVPDITGRTW